MLDSDPTMVIKTFFCHLTHAHVFLSGTSIRIHPMLKCCRLGLVNPDMICACDQLELARYWSRDPQTATHFSPFIGWRSQGAALSPAPRPLTSNLGLSRRRGRRWRISDGTSIEGTWIRSIVNLIIHLINITRLMTAIIGLKSFFSHVYVESFHWKVGARIPAHNRHT